MSKSVRSRAEELFSSTRSKDTPVLGEKEKAQQEKADHIANLRALRLAKETADKQSAGDTAAKKPAAKRK